MGKQVEGITSWEEEIDIFEDTLLSNTLFRMTENGLGLDPISPFY